MSSFNQSSHFVYLSFKQLTTADQLLDECPLQYGEKNHFKKRGFLFSLRITGSQPIFPPLSLYCVLFSPLESRRDQVFNFHTSCIFVFLKANQKYLHESL
eukprot:TRINITY_DN3047_c0_g1_i3.p3 TRINITY_DN3047_c0_g1~~TRINITY_DN3047_c0_g1_i3.p3  ORF type:complete len:100 (+),score=2.38 TRINITY_DN3047_c0_g1_i3:537-836(+)